MKTAIIITYAYKEEDWLKGFFSSLGQLDMAQRHCHPTLRELRRLTAFFSINGEALYLKIFDNS